MQYLVDVGPLVYVPGVNAADALESALFSVGGVERIPLPARSWRVYRLDDERRVMEVIAA